MDLPEDLINVLIENEDKPFDQLVAMVGLDPKKDFRNTNLSGIDFTGSNLSGFDFSGADLRGCLFGNIDLAEAILDQAMLDDEIQETINEGIEEIKVHTEETEFRAPVQYGDMRGSISADNAAMLSATKFLTDKNEIGSEEYVVGISIWIGENHGEYRDPVTVNFLVTKLGESDNNVPQKIEESEDPIDLRKISIDMGIFDFLALFKRLSINISSNGILEGRTIRTTSVN